MFSEIAVIKSGGDLGSAVAHRLVQSGFSVIITERAEPLSIRRKVSFSEAVYQQETVVEGVTARKASKEDPEGVLQLCSNGIIPVLVDEKLDILSKISVDIVIDATLRKKNVDMHRELAPITIALGPGFTAPEDVDAVIETNRGHQLGRIYYWGNAMEDTGVPGVIDGFSRKRVIYSQQDGCFYGIKKIGDVVKKGDPIGEIHDPGKNHGSKIFVRAPIDGMIRGLIPEGCSVSKGMKIGDVDPRGKMAHYDLISDKGRTISGGVLEAVLHLMNQKKPGGGKCIVKK